LGSGERLGEVVKFSRKPRSLRIRENDEIPFIPMELIPDSGKYAGWLIKNIQKYQAELSFSKTTLL